jgi:hypothetical protein
MDRTGPIDDALQQQLVTIGEEIFFSRLVGFSDHNHLWRRPSDMCSKLQRMRLFFSQW